MCRFFEKMIIIGVLLVDAWNLLKPCCAARAVLRYEQPHQKPNMKQTDVSSAQISCAKSKMHKVTSIQHVWGPERLFFGTFAFSCIRGSNSRGLGSNSRGLGPNSRGLGPNSRGLVPKFPQFSCSFSKMKFCSKIDAFQC